MARKAREREFTAKLNIHLKNDPILLRGIIRFIRLAIKLGEEEERTAEFQKEQSGEFPQREQNIYGL